MALGRFFPFLPVPVELLVPLYLADVFHDGRNIALALHGYCWLGLELTWLGFWLFGVGFVMG